MTNESASLRKRFFAVPSTQLGRWAVGLAAGSIVLILAWSILGGAMLGFLCGIGGGVLALVAVIRQHERSWLVFLSILPSFWVLIFILGEFLVPH